MRRLLKIAGTYAAFACILIAVVNAVDLSSDNAVGVVVFGSVGLTYFWFQFRPLPPGQKLNEKN